MKFSQLALSYGFVGRLILGIMPCFHQMPMYSPHANRRARRTWFPTTAGVCIIISILWMKTSAVPRARADVAALPPADLPQRTPRI